MKSREGKGALAIGQMLRESRENGPAIVITQILVFYFYFRVYTSIRLNVIRQAQILDSNHV